MCSSTTNSALMLPMSMVWDCYSLMCLPKVMTLKKARKNILFVQSWVMKTIKDPAYTLIAYLKDHFAAAKRSVTTLAISQTLPSQAAGNNWDRCATKFQSSELDLLMIEELAKAEGPPKMVLEEISGQVIGLNEYRKGVEERATRQRLRSVSGRLLNPVEKDMKG